MRMKGIVIMAVMVLAGVNVQAARSAAARSASAPYQAVQTDAHKPVTYHFAITNTTDKAQTVESVRASCACLKVAVATSASLPPGESLPFDVEFNPTGMEGPVTKRVWVSLAPSKNIETFEISETVRLRLGFKPMDAAFGVIRRSDTGREIVAKLSGYAAAGAKLGNPFLATKDAEESVFDVRLAPDGKSVVAKFRDSNVLPGIYSETWTIPTSDPEIPEIKFPVSARVADVVSVTPQVITVGWDEPVCARFVMIRGDASLLNPGNPVNPVEETHRASAPLRENLTVLSAETKPRKWGDVKVSPRPMNGWRIDIENIDPREVRQFSKLPFIEVKTNLPGMESFEIPFRVVNDGGAK